MLADRIRMSSHKTKKLIDRTTPTTVVNEPHSTEGNGGRKLVRLENGWLVASVYDRVAQSIKFYCSKDDGATFIHLRNVNQTREAYFAIACRGIYIYVISTGSSGGVYTLRFNAIDPIGSHQYIKTLESGLTGGSGVSLTMNEEKTELHACWSCKNSTYPNSFNIRYCKGVIDINGSVTWGSVEQLTTNNSSKPEDNYQDSINPSIIINNLGNPVIIYNVRGGYAYASAIRSIAMRTDGTWRHNNVYVGTSTLLQSSPSACVDKDGVIHVAWHGSDSTESKNQIRYSKSIDGGLTWSSMKVIAPLMGINYTGYPSISSNVKGELFVSYMYGGSHYEFTKSVDGGDSWLTRNLNLPYYKYPSSLDDNTLDFDIPLTIGMGANDVKFLGKWYE